MDGRKKASAQVVVEVLILAHLKHFLPLLHGHLILHALRTLIFLTQLLTTKLHKLDVQQINTTTLFPRSTHSIVHLTPRQRASTVLGNVSK